MTRERVRQIAGQAFDKLRALVEPVRLRDLVETTA